MCIRDRPESIALTKGGRQDLILLREANHLARIEHCRRAFADAAEAQRAQVRLPDVYLDLNGFDVPWDDAVAIAAEVLAAEPSISDLWIADALT